jgi:uncharacterized membrane protein
VAVHHGPFGDDVFGRRAEAIARFFGTPQYLIGQSLVVVAWIVVNAVAFGLRWDPYPFILLNLAFSTQAAYAAPLILLAQTRQADRDKSISEKVERRHARLETGMKAETDRLLELLQSNTELTQRDKELTEQVADLTSKIHSLLVAERRS